MPEIKPLVIESDARSRLALVSMLNACDGVTVQGVVSSAMQLKLQVKQRQPNVLILMLASFDEKSLLMMTDLLEETSIPVVILSQQLLARNNIERTIMKYARAVVMPCKPQDIMGREAAFFDKLKRTLKQLISKWMHKKVASQPSLSASKNIPGLTKQAGLLHRANMDALIALGASTGGTEALRHVIDKLPASAPAVVVVQHLPAAFAASFIQKLNQHTAMNVVAATDGLPVHKGHIYIGAGDQHFTIAKKASGFVCHLGGKQRVDGHCPSVNELFNSVALCAGSKAVGVLMTGMGEDGATGLKKMRDARAKTVAQDQASSVVWGMPGTAVRLGAVQEQVALDDLAAKIMQLVMMP